MMKKLLIVPMVAGLAACGSVPAVVTSIFDTVNTYTEQHCGYTFAFATIDAVIKALTGQPLADVIGGLLCTQARMLAAQQAFNRTAIATPEGSAVVLGTVIINGKPVTITVLR
jgi:hypothetical protein